MDAGYETPAREPGILQVLQALIQTVSAPVSAG